MHSVFSGKCYFSPSLKKKKSRKKKIRRNTATVRFDCWGSTGEDLVGNSLGEFGGEHHS